jgi:cyanophycin synthetase
MELRDSRRLTGPNFVWERPGAVLDLLMDPSDCTGSPSALDALTAAWQTTARQMLDALGWTASLTRAKRVGVALEDGAQGVGLSLALSAPLDVLYAACEVNEWALEAAQALLAGAGQDALDADFHVARERLAALIQAEANPALLALEHAARAQGVGFLSDDEIVSVGMGHGSISWPVSALPSVNSVDWSAVFDIPHVIVTGTNGKSTTVRLLASMAAAAGEVPGISSTDFVRVGSDVLDHGDWSGPGGGRMLLRDPRVTVGLLETARGGMMRRGLALSHTNLAVVLNIGDDHLTEWGTPDLASLAEAKFIPVRVAKAAVLNADDPEIVAAVQRGLAGAAELIWFSLDPKQAHFAEHLKRGGRGVWLKGRELVATSGAACAPTSRALETQFIAHVEDIPMTLGGAARYNVANALAAVAVAMAMRFSVGAIRSGLSRFESNPNDNPGRLNRFALGGVTVLVDFAHNPSGFVALFAAAAALPAKRRLVLIGQSGDRDAVSTRGMVRSAVDAGLDHIVIKELTEHLRGRELGEMPAQIEAELRALGLDETRFTHAPNEMAAVHVALEWAQPGDLLLLLAHDARDQVLALITELKAAGWEPGRSIPAH